MSTPTVSLPDLSPDEGLDVLRNGDHLDQPTFHARYKASGEGVRAELIGGRVYMASPIKTPHSFSHSDLHYWLRTYALKTPGTVCCQPVTIILGEDSEPEPDLSLFVLPPHGNCVEEDKVLRGSPELVIEIAYSTQTYDLFDKKLDYERYGVREYVVFALKQRRMYWFARNAQNRFAELPEDEKRVIGSQAFPGLWLDVEALLQRDLAAMLATLEAGLATQEHRAFVASLAASSPAD